MDSSEYQQNQKQPLKISGRRPSPLNVRKDTHNLKKQRTRAISPPPRLEFKLRFVKSPASLIFTYSRIVAADGSPVTIEIVDAAMERRVTSGPYSSSRIKIVPLDANFTEENWTTEEFNQKIVWPRESQRSLLAGDLTVTLKDGVGVIEDIAFTDNSNRKFRLGAKAIGGGVVEAKSEAFVCEDHQGESSSSMIGKHHPPYPESEIWRLEGISENGIEQLCLAVEGIHTVKDLRRCFAMNPDSLQILGKCVEEKMLETIVSHAMSCVLDETECYIFHAKAQGAFLLFNSVYELMKVSLDGVTSPNSDQLTSNQKALVEDLKRKAYENVNDFVAVDRWAFTDPSPETLSSSSESFFDVVFSYRRGDICSEFISHLRAALCRRRVSVYDYDEDSTQHLKCKALVIFLTENYVPCNLADILEQKNHVIVPIFYGLTPSDLLSKIESYKRFFLCDKTKRWWDALHETAQMSGYILANKTESELIDEIVIHISKVLCSNGKKRNMIGMDLQVEEILSLLCIDSTDVRRLGIWGTVGIGKTTIAEEIFRRISVQYETCVFLRDLHEEIEEKGHDAVKEEFLSKILEVEPHVLRISDMKTSFLRSTLQRKKVLVILDDVKDFRDVETFIGNINYFGPGSRVIITSTNRRVFVRFNFDHVYRVKPLDYSESLMLLNYSTLQSGMLISTDDFSKRSLELVEFANGNPLVLHYMLSRWDVELEQTSPIYIPGIFERSCYGLDDHERSIFLDIACFFRKIDKDNVAMLLDGCGFSAHIGFKSLVEKSLLTITHNLVDMHNFIQATGREIVLRESVERPGERSRLWNAEDIRDVFVFDSGTTVVEAIFLDMSKVKFDATPNVFEKMRNLRLLKFYSYGKNHGVLFPDGLEYLPTKLRLLHWEYYPFSSLPLSFDPRNLVELNLPSSSIQKLWKGTKSLEKLKRLRLSHSFLLNKLPRFSSAPNLEHIDLEGCKSLVRISQSISDLKKLVSLNLKDCSKLEKFPEVSPSVKELYIGGTMIQQVPYSIKNLALLEKLDLENNTHLVDLPTSICKLKHLETLNLSGCSRLERFPDLPRKMKCLRFLDLSKTAIRELPSSSISNLIALKELRFVDCKNLVRLPDDNTLILQIDIEFRQIDTEKFSRLWNRFG